MGKNNTKTARAGITRRACLQSASAVLLGAPAPAAEPVSGEWTRYRLISEDGTPKRLLRTSLNVEDVRELRLLAGRGPVLDTEPVVHGIGVLLGSVRPIGFWVPETQLSEREFILESVALSGAVARRPLVCGSVPRGDEKPLRLDRTNDWLRRHMLTREQLPRAGELADFVPDMARYLAQHRIIYEQPAGFWGEGLILGNGAAGALVTGERNKSQTIYLDRCDLWGAMPDGRAMGRVYGGRLDLRFTADGSEYLQELLLHDAEVLTRDGRLTTAARVCATGDLVQVEITWNGTEPLDIECELSRPDIPMPMDDKSYSYSMGAAASRLNGIWNRTGEVSEELRNLVRNAPHTEVRAWVQDGCAGVTHTLPNMQYAMCVGLSGVAAAWKDASEDRLARVRATVRIPPGRNVHLLVALTSDRVGPDPDARAVSMAAQALPSPERLRADHRDWWRAYWERSFVELPDKLIENHWYFEAYHQACFSRDLVATSFFGLWHPLDWRSWLDSYTADVEPPMLFWGPIAINHLELLLASHNTYGRLLVEYLEHSAQGAMVPQHGFPDYGGGHTSFGVTHQKGPTGWMTQNFYWDYEYTGDTELLTNVTYPLLAGCADYYLYNLKLEADGKYHCGESESPEQDNTAKDNIYDRAIIERCLRSAIDAARTLRVDADRAAAWQQRLERLFDYPQDERAICETTQNRQPYRGHASVMYPVFPSATIQPGDALWQKANATYDIVTNLIGHNPDGRHRTIPGHEGGIEPNAFNASFLLAAAARLRDWREVRRIYYAMVVRLQLKRNGQTSVADVRHRPDMINMSIAEGVCGQLRGLTQTLVQDYQDHVRVFPASDPEGITRFAGLRSYGGFLLAGEHGGGGTAWVAVHSLKGNAFRMMNPWQGELRIEPSTPIRRSKLKDGHEALEFDTRTGVTYRLSPARDSGPRLPEPMVERRQAPREILIRDGADFEPMVVYFPIDERFAQFSRGDRIYLGMPREERSQPLPVDMVKVREWMRSPDWRYRQTAARLLWREATPEARRLLGELANDSSTVVRYAALGREGS
jgi:hypothetical protein